MGVITQGRMLVALEGTGAPSASPVLPLGCAEGHHLRISKYGVTYQINNAYLLAMEGKGGLSPPVPLPVEVLAEGIERIPSVSWRRS
jgi:hypothetical protein